MNIFAVSGLINTISVFALGSIVYFKNRKKEINIRYALFCFFVAFWSFSYFFWQNSQDRNSALLWSRYFMAGAIFIPICFLHFVLLLLDLYEKRKKIVNAGYLIFLLFFILNFTHLFIKDVKPKMFFKFWPIPGPVFSIFLLIWFLYCFYPCYLLIKYYKKFSGIRQQQLKYVLIAILIGYTSGSTNYFLWYDIPIAPYGNFVVPLFVGMMAYAVVRYRLMDINLILTRAAIFVIVYALVLGIPIGLTGWGRYWLQGIFGAHWYWASIILAIVLATLGPFIYLWIDRRAEENLLKEQRRYQKTLKQASIGMTRIRDMRRLLALIAHIVTKTVKISYVGIYLYDKEKNEFVIEVNRDKGRVPITKVAADNPIIAYFNKSQVPLVYEEVKQMTDDSGDIDYKLIEEHMRLLFATLVIPSFLEEKLIGFIVLGEKATGQIYTPEDLSVFQVLAAQAALAIENARFFEETKQMQDQVAQAEKMATIGTMADGMSHQINNRFYALSLIAGDTIDTIKITDTSSCSPEIKQMLEQINYALGRIQDNVIQGGAVVKGLLKYSRKSEENMEEITLDQVIDGTLEMVQYKVKLSEIDLDRAYSKDIPKIKGIQVQLQEAFFNFIDNAYDSIVERRTILKEPKYRGRISISAVAKGNRLEITIEDNGMGIKDGDTKKIFTPFFTTKTSSRKGTGLGLYVINKIITDTHKGTLQFESAWKTGTRFIIQLPIAL